MSRARGKANQRAAPTALQEWSQDEQKLHPQAVIVEFGYRDQFDWRLGSRMAHLGQAAYDAYLQRQIDEYVKVLGQSGTKILLLSVPWTQPPSLPDGAPAPAASPGSSRQINAMLRPAASRYPGQVRCWTLTPWSRPRTTTRRR